MTYTMDEKRIFSDQELKVLATPLSDRICEAIDSGQYDVAKALAQELGAESTPNLHAFEEFVAALIAYIYQQHGDDVLEDALRYCANIVIAPMLESILALSVRERVEAFARLFRAHSGRALRIEEDDEKVTLVLDPCGSGGWMVQEGAFGPEGKFPCIEKAQGITFGRENFPCYCAHCAVLHHIVPIEQTGAPFPPIEVGEGPGDPCKWIFYKDHAEVPERYYAQVGMQREGKRR